MINSPRKRIKQRTVVIGLDGVSYTMLQELRKNKCIPNMEKLFENGFLGQMSVCIPEISSVSWSSFMTGTQSGEHGIFGFIDLIPGSYKYDFPNYTYLKSPTLWDDLANLGKKTIAINVPSTYPARQINGLLISGFVAIDLSKAVFPINYLPTLKKMDYRIDIDTRRAAKDYDFLFNDLNATLLSRERAAELFWEEIDWDLFILVITGTDRLMHFLWNAYENKEHQYHHSFLEYFQSVDDIIGRFVNRFLELDGSINVDKNFFMLSDHGFTAIKSEVFLNTWLKENGYLNFQSEKPETLMDIGPKSYAFALDPSRIYLNLSGKYPMGEIRKTEYDSLRYEFKEGLESLKSDSQDRVIKKVYFKEELYNGAYTDIAPDLVALSYHGYDLKGKVGSDNIFSRSNLEGMHTQDDAFFYSSNGKECTSIFDVKNNILSTFI